VIRVVVSGCNGLLFLRAIGLGDDVLGA
jgi:hypothetical protein